MLQLARRFLCLALAFAFGLEGSPSLGSDSRLTTILDRYSVNGVVRSAIGVTSQGTAIPCFIAEEELAQDTQKYRILIVGGLDGTTDSVERSMKVLTNFQSETELHERYTVSCVPCARPDALSQNALTELRFPPEGNAYNEPENDEAQYLWRWIGMHAPDLVIDLRAGSGSTWAYPTESMEAVETICKRLSENSMRPAVDGSLIVALSEGSPSEVGSIPGFQSDSESLLRVITTALDTRFESPPSSAARKEINRRSSRSTREVMQELAEVYGGRLDRVMYIPSLAVMGRMRLGEVTGNDRYLRDAMAMASPYRSGEKESMPAKGNGSVLSGHLVFSELARRSGDSGWTALAKKAADHGFDASGQPKESMPFHNEMSDSVFMGCAILAEVGALTGDEKYFDQCLRHLRFMQARCLRDDGLYRHSPLDEAAWGRGNGFPALGISLSLSALPEDSEAFPFFLKSYRAHLNALRKHQDPTGAWHQVIDREESYREFTATCMITFAMVRGMRRGWLDHKEWSPVVERAWHAIKSRIGRKGRLVDVCTGTGKQKTLRQYFDRTAILGPDDRGGAMALMVSTEIAFWEKERESGSK
ncbi:MAG: glycoside hydrolase family 88 protein [Planctomycetota bacterium]